MTLVLALASAEGIVLASDSQATYSTSGQSTKGETQKLHDQWTNVAWGAAGDVGLIQRVREGMQIKYKNPDNFERSNVRQARDHLAKGVAETLRPLFTERFINFPGILLPGAVFLFAGYVNGEPFIVEVGQNFADTDHIDKGYAAIGSGDIFPYYAMAGLAHFDVRQRSLDEAKLIAYRVMDDAINVAAFGLGPPIQMIELNKQPSSHCRQLDPDEIRMVGDKVTEWKQVERESLTTLVGVNPPS